MHLTSHTDFALRTLLVLALCAPEKVTTSEICGAFEISENHLAKVIQHLARLGYVETIRGKEGGVRLARPPQGINLGTAVRELESELGVVPCLRAGGEECFITPVCSLKPILKDATETFLKHLDQFTLADVCRGNGRGAQPLKRRLAQRLTILQ
jgi:Rrf2 family transcriptional regulator, nitric oxide-sensitive transcriptional repressor